MAGDPNSDTAIGAGSIPNRQTSTPEREYLEQKWSVPDPGLQIGQDENTPDATSGYSAVRRLEALMPRIPVTRWPGRLNGVSRKRHNAEVDWEEAVGPTNAESPCTPPNKRMRVSKLEEQPPKKQSRNQEPNLESSQGEIQERAFGIGPPMRNMDLYARLGPPHDSIVDRRGSPRRFLRGTTTATETRSALDADPELVVTSESEEKDDSDSAIGSDPTNLSSYGESMMDHFGVDPNLNRNQHRTDGNPFPDSSLNRDDGVRG
ncbi:hypothetical protein N7495_007642 [Penicillium taxi]|uniref:uncharacterized protein n=1 Tax=Penicillium taxi TaxID=168475 RepID=UPI0025458BDB|nr:uncharacterized protein N7495_007642 [Penicillium taxi]KAJ5887601.1 hypothetical protein N7495_007642 [Penicillium taxi]